MPTQGRPPTPLRTRLIDYARLLRLNRPIGILLLGWPTLWALWLASAGWPSWELLAIFTFGTILTRSAGCAINDFADRDFDPHVARTKDRPLAAGRISSAEALAVFAVVMLLALLVALPLPIRALWLAVPAILLAASYPFVKRVTHFPQAYLGVAFSWGIPMAYAAVSSQPDWVQAGMLMAANLCWVIAYDTLYAMVDREDDLRVGVKSTAIAFGRFDLFIVGVLHAVCLLLLLWIGLRSGLAWPFYAGLVVAAALAAQEQWMARQRDAAACFAAFNHNNWFGAAIFAGLVFSLL